MINESTNMLESQVTQEMVDCVAKAFTLGESGYVDGWEDMFLDKESDNLILVDGGIEEYEVIVFSWKSHTIPVKVDIDGNRGRYIEEIRVKSGDTKKSFVLVDFGGFSLIYFQ